MTDKLLVLVDGSSYLFRAFHALPQLSNSRGQPTGAVYGVANMLRRLQKDYGSHRIAVVFDARGRTFRDDLFEAYKANRPPMPDDLAAQIQPLHELVSAMGFPVIQIQGVEADDVIGTLAQQAREQGLVTVISTGDKDMAQLVDDNTTLVNTMTGVTLDRGGVKEKFDVFPEQIIDFLALVGDSSDNIPGVPKVGPKTAAKWLNQYGTLDEIVARAGDIPGKAGESLREHLEQLTLSRKLATIRRDVTLELQPNALQMTTPEIDRLRSIYHDLEFASWLRELDKAETTAVASHAAPPGTGADYATVLTTADLEHWISTLRDAGVFAFDTETTSLNYMEAELVGLSFATRAGEAAYVPVAHDYPGAPSQLNRDAVLNCLRPLLEDAHCAKIGHHIKYDAHILANYGIRLDGMRFDSMLESYVLDSTATRHDLDTLAARFLAYTTTTFEQLAGKGARQKRFDRIPIEEAAPYAAEDADITLRLHEFFWPRLQQTASLQRVYEELEVPLIPVLLAMERAGVLIDITMLEAQSRELAEKMSALQEQARELAGQEFNLASPKQLQEILFDKLNLPVVRKTPKGQPSTAEDVLQELAAQYPLPQVILDYRAMAKLKSTYTDRLPGEVNAKTGRVHTSYHQAVAATGRLSSSDPNLQNIPVRTPEGRRIRQAFIAPRGYRLVAADYSQIELRIMAHLSGDHGLLTAFSEGLDIHRATAAEVLGLKPEAVSEEQRRSAKAINFGLIYGMSAFGLGRQLGIDRTEAQAYVDRYFERYPGVKRFMDETRELARARGFVETVFGRRLYVPDIKASNAQRRQYAERTAINAPMQGTAADIIKRAMIDVQTWLASSEIDARMIMQVHDELVFEVADDQVDRLREKVTELMCGAGRLRVPLVVDTGAGSNWDEAH